MSQGGGKDCLQWRERSTRGRLCDTRLIASRVGNKGKKRKALKLHSAPPLKEKPSLGGSRSQAPPHAWHCGACYATRPRAGTGGQGVGRIVTHMRSRESVAEEDSGANGWLWVGFGWRGLPR